MISKELYWEIAKENKFFTWASFKPDSIDDIECLILNGNNEIQVWKVDGGIISIINIHELAHKCKEWAKNEGITNFQSQLGDVGASSMFMDGFDFYDFEADTEPEAIFKACQWIIEQGDEK